MEAARSTKDVWLNPAADSADRLLAFHRWLSWRIAKLFNIERDNIKLIAQMRAIVLKSVRELNERGYLLDGSALADHLETQFGAIRQYHRTSKIKDLYAYWRTAWDAYVRTRAEEIRRDSMRLGMHISDYTSPYRPSIPELESERHAESLRERLQNARRKAACKPPADPQQTLFN